jgi:ABC-2 type transport system ATP-binding protein
MNDAPATERPVTIRADRLSKVYGEFVALHDVSFEVRRGTVAAFLGPNGAGKSTTMKILTGYLAPTAGSARVLDLDPTDPEQRLRLAPRLGYLPENGPLYMDLTPFETFEFIGNVRRLGAGLPKAIERVVEQCAISTVLHKPVRKLSKGFRQRVGMAQALLHDPDVLIMDEPTSGLDPLQIREMRGLIRELGKHKTLLLSTHILQEVEAVADEVVMVHEGRIVFNGTLERLRADRSLEERFYELAATQEKEVA